jgi:hypothetical protein
MICATCQVTVPDDSTFCLRCGARLIPVERVVPVNGGKGAALAMPAGRATTPVVRPTVGSAVGAAAGPAGKQAYSLSFKPLSDERLRYRVARWVCEVAPAHPISEVQQNLLTGQFATFLALTPQEAETAGQRIQALGAHPALWRLAPASTAELLLPEKAPGKPEWSAQKKFAVVGISLLILFLFGAIAWNRYQTATSSLPTQQRTVPTLGARP